MGSTQDKLAELIPYIADRHETDELFGSVRLAKTLFYADFLFYAKHGRSIADARCVRMQNGPAPDSLLNTRDCLQRKGDLVMKERFVRG